MTLFTTERRYRSYRVRTDLWPDKYIHLSDLPLVTD